MASAIPVPIEKVIAELPALDAAAGWFRLEKSSPSWTPWFIMEPQLLKVIGVCKGFLEGLGISDMHSLEVGLELSGLWDRLTALLRSGPMWTKPEQSQLMNEEKAGEHVTTYKELRTTSFDVWQSASVTA